MNKVYITAKTLLLVAGMAGLSAHQVSADVSAKEKMQDTVLDKAIAPEVKRPKIGWARWNEDWSVLKETGNQKFFDPIKYIPLNEEGDIYLSFGGQLRQRVEVWNNFGFTGANDDVFLLSRYQAHADLHITKHFRAFVEGNYSHIPDQRDLPGGTRAALDANEGDLTNAFVDFSFELGDADITLRGGRQQFYFGKQRIISALPWANNYRKWDGFSGIVKYEDITVTPFFAWNVPTSKFHFDDVAGTENTGNGATKIFGAYATKKGLGDLYYIGRTRTANGSSNGEAYSHTIGARRGAKIGDTGFDYEFEGAFQILSDPSNDDFAYMLGGHIGYTFADVPTKPWVYTGIEMGSASYDQVFPLGHAYFGYIDALGRGNMIDWKSGVKFSPIKKLTIQGDFHAYFREDTDEGITTVAGGAFRGNADPTNEAFVGTELDITAKYPIAPYTSLLVGYSHFFAGDFIDDTGAADDIDFFYTQVMVRF
ncbi:MAG: alginate export family protein [Verrucomicrobiota bacterium]